MESNRKDNPRTHYPSIFNDVIGPVMRGPSSSHCAAALRIGRIARDLMDAKLEDVLVEFDRHGSLATTHTSQGSDMGLFAGFLGWDPTDERLVESSQELQAAGIQVQIKITDYPAVHPNTYKMTLSSGIEKHTMTAISTGGGAIEVIQIDGCEVSMSGDFYETLVYVESDAERVLNFLLDNVVAGDIQLFEDSDTQFIEIKDGHFLEQETTAELCSKYQVKSIKTISPVLPILSSQTNEIPFLTSNELLQYNQGKDLDAEGRCACCTFQGGRCEKPAAN